MNTKRLAREREAAARPTTEVGARDTDRLQALLDEALAALPDIYRSAIVLCDLEGKTIKEAARQLGCPQGTLGTRLARASGLACTGRTDLVELKALFPRALQG